MCPAQDGVRNLIMLDRRCAIPGHGWGCLVCGLPMDGAYAVLCDPCLERYRENDALLTTVCAGYPGSEGRVLVDALPPGVFEHDQAKHAADNFIDDRPCEDCPNPSRCQTAGRCWFEEMETGL